MDRTGCVDVAVIQSLYRKDEVKDFVAEYGQVIVDECHHISAFTFEQVMRQVKAKALVTSNVYDTATGIHLLIPQGSRLVGVYDSQVAYGQDGVQVAWTRIIFPDASSIDLNGMAGMDAQGNAGLRGKVDRHYKRLFGMAVLSSMFAVAFELTQQRNRTVLTLPSVQETAGATVGREIGQIGAQITRRNLNVQPTIKVPAEYKFTVRVNRDIVFEGPYEPLVPPGETTPAMRAQK